MASFEKPTASVGECIAPSYENIWQQQRRLARNLPLTVWRPSLNTSVERSGESGMLLMVITSIESTVKC